MHHGDVQGASLHLHHPPSYKCLRQWEGRLFRGEGHPGTQPSLKALQIDVQHVACWLQLKGGPSWTPPGSYGQCGLQHSLEQDWTISCCSEPIGLWMRLQEEADLGPSVCSASQAGPLH